MEEIKKKKYILKVLDCCSFEKDKYLVELTEYIDEKEKKEEEIKPEPKYINKYEEPL